MKVLRTAVVATVAVLLLLGGGIWLGGHPEHLPGPLRDSLVQEDRAVRAEILGSIDDSFYKRVKRSTIEEASLKGVVEGLGDQFSHYLTPKEARSFQQSVQGRFEGVGMNVEEDGRGLRVTRVFEGSPADDAGIRQGEYIIAVDGRSIAGVSSDVATARIKGDAGTKVRLEVINAEEGEPRTLTVTREEIQVPVTEGRMVRRDGAKYGVVRLSTFSEKAGERVRKEVDGLLGRGAEGIVFDLRGNGGGLLDEAVLTASQFIEDGLIVYTKGRSRPRRDFQAQGEAIDPKVPVVVLVDRGSASASEIVTGALRDRKRATVVGTRTFGKGVFQELEPLSNGGILDITVGEYFLPDGENIQDKGIRPDVRARDDQDTDRDEAMPVALRVLARER